MKPRKPAALRAQGEVGPHRGQCEQQHHQREAEPLVPGFLAAEQRPDKIKGIVAVESATAGKVENADPQAIPHAVIRFSMAARTIDHVDVTNFAALAPDQGRQKPVQTVEIRQQQAEFAGKRLQPAARVARAVAQNRAANAVGDARLHALEARRLAPDPLTRNQSDVRRTMIKRIDELWKKCRIVLAVTVERDDRCAARRYDPGAQG